LTIGVQIDARQRQQCRRLPLAVIEPRSDPMKDNKNVVRINLTSTQKDQLKNQTGKDAESIELSVTELEERIVPRLRY